MSPSSFSATFGSVPCFSVDRTCEPRDRDRWSSRPAPDSRLCDSGLGVRERDISQELTTARTSLNRVFGSKVSDFGFRVRVFGFSGFGFRVSDWDFGILSFGCRVPVWVVRV